MESPTNAPDEMIKTLPVIQNVPGSDAGPDKAGFEAPPEPSPLKLILTLGTAGFVSGLCLVLVYLATAPAIERNRVAAIESAVFQVLPGAESFAVFADKGDKVVRLDDASEAGSMPVVYAGYDGDGKAVGFAIPGAGPGFQDTLEILIGWDHKRKRVVGMAVLETRETPGLGDKIITDDNFTSSFENLSIEPQAVLVDPGRRSKDNEVDGISGATISALAIVRIINSTVPAWDKRLPDPDEGQEEKNESSNRKSNGTRPGERGQR